jgi:hypothetical protein
LVLQQAVSVVEHGCHLSPSLLSALAAARTSLRRLRGGAMCGRSSIRLYQPCE